MPDEVLYFDGNSLGVLPKTTAADLNITIASEWGDGLIRGWLESDWFFLPQQAGDAVASLLGASAGEVVVSDSTSVNIFKLAAALLRQSGTRRKVITETGNFPTDGYILEGLVELLDKDHQLVFCPADELADAIDRETALVLLTHVNYRTGAVHDMESLTAACHDKGVPIIWDLCHSAGAVPLALNDCGVDYAVGCTYKFLNGGPGSPSFSYISQSAIGAFEPVVTGWFSHANQFAFEDGYRPASSINKLLVGSPQILSLRGVLNGIKSYDGVSMNDLREKSVALSELFIELADEKLAAFGFDLASPRDAARRGSQVSFNHREAYAISQALIERNLIPDYRDPNILRFGITPLYMRYTDVWDCVEVIEEVMKTSAWKFHQTDVKAAVT